MTLEQLQKDMIAAMKAGDKSRKEVISSLVSAVKKAGIDNGCKDNITEDLVAKVLLKEQKTAKEMIDTCPASREDLLEKYNYNYGVISEYAPKLITDPEEIKSIIMATLNGQGLEPIKKNKGVIMKALNGRADMAVVNKVTGEILA